MYLFPLRLLALTNYYLLQFKKEWMNQLNLIQEKYFLLNLEFPSLNVALKTITVFYKLIYYSHQVQPQILRLRMIFLN
jgi:hypothetical protein